MLPKCQNSAFLLKARLIMLSCTSYSSCLIVLCWGLAKQSAPASLVWLSHLPPLLLFSHPVVSNSLQPHGLQHTRPPCPSPCPEVCPSSCPLHQWRHSAISSSDTLFSFCPQSCPASGSFPTSRLLASDDRPKLLPPLSIPIFATGLFTQMGHQ